MDQDLFFPRSYHSPDYHQGTAGFAPQVVAEKRHASGQPAQGVVSSGANNANLIGCYVPKIESAIPVGTQFSPDLLNIEAFIGAILAHSGDKPGLVNAIWRSPVRTAPVRTSPTFRRASLPLEAAIQYGLLDDSYRATELARELSNLRGQPLFDAFARHILLRLGGLRVVEGAQQMALDEPQTGVSITGDTLAAYLTDQGFRVTVHNTAINSLRLWLSKAGVFPEKGWEVDVTAKERLIGLSDAGITAVLGLGDDEQALLLALCRLRPKGEYPAATVRENAERELGRRLERGSLPKLLDPLKSAGFIDYRAGGTRSGKSAVVWTLPKFDADVLEPFLKGATKQLDSALTAHFARDWTEIHKDLDSKDTFVKGQALEAYAIQIMRRLGLRFVSWRVHARDKTGQAEVDAVLSGVTGGNPTRWQIQCKNTPSGQVDLGDVAKEVGLLPITKATHILLLANCTISRDARIFASEVMRNSPVTIYLLDRKDFEAIRRSSGGALASILTAKAHAAAALPRHGLDWLGGARP